jgi:hypothetical protein
MIKVHGCRDEKLVEESPFRTKELLWSAYALLHQAKLSEASSIIFDLHQGIVEYSDSQLMVFSNHQPMKE